MLAQHVASSDCCTGLWRAFVADTERFLLYVSSAVQLSIVLPHTREHYGSEWVCSRRYKGPGGCKPLKLGEGEDGLVRLSTLAVCLAPTVACLEKLLGLDSLRTLQSTSKQS